MKRSDQLKPVVIAGCLFLGLGVLLIRGASHSNGEVKPPSPPVQPGIGSGNVFSGAGSGGVTPAYPTPAVPPGQAEYQQKQAKLYAARLIEERIARLQKRLDELQAASGDLALSTRDYMLRHRMATAAVIAGAGGVAVAFDPKTTNEAKTLGLLTTIVAVIWANDNKEEVNEVARELTRVVGMQNAYRDQMKSVSRTIEEERAKLAQL